MKLAMHWSIPHFWDKSICVIYSSLVKSLFLILECSFWLVNPLILKDTPTELILNTYISSSLLKGPTICIGVLYIINCFWIHQYPLVICLAHFLAVESICTFQHRRHGTWGKLPMKSLRSQTCQAPGSDGAQPMRPRRAAYNAGGDARAAATGAREEPPGGREGWNISYIIPLD